MVLIPLKITDTSGWFHNQRKAGPDFAKRFPDLNAYIQYTVKQHWLPYIQQAQQFGMQHPDQYYELRYEDLHAATRPICGPVPASDACIDSTDLWLRELDDEVTERVSGDEADDESNRDLVHAITDLVAERLREREEGGALHPAILGPPSGPRKRREPPTPRHESIRSSP